MPTALIDGLTDCTWVMDPAWENPTHHYDLFLVDHYAWLLGRPGPGPAPPL